MSTVVTRFPPSPTGLLHVGGARTALFNWLYARHCKGRFILRIEDTDLERSTQASVDSILDALRWLGIDWDEGPYFQSQRLDIYQQHVQRLLDSGHAYWCTCPPEKIEAMRQQAMATGGKPKYDGTCRERWLSPTPGAAVRFKTPLGGTTVLPDVVKGSIVFQNSELDDFIIQRSDGWPTYNFVVVVDDVSMGINTIIRGDDHVNNTPKQILIYRALGAELPVFGHVPMVLGKDRTRLSKRHGATSVTAYRDLGILPDALINYLVRLGWSHGDQEFFKREELIDRFNLEHLGRSAGIFDMDKLLALNADHIKACTPGAVAKHLRPHLQQRGFNAYDTAYLEALIPTLQARSKTLVEMAEAAGFYFETPALEKPLITKHLTAEVRAPLEQLRALLGELTDFSEASLALAFQQVQDTHQLKLGKLAQPLRVALTGKAVSPGIFEILGVLGKERVLARLDAALRQVGT